MSGQLPKAKQLGINNLASKKHIWLEFDQGVS